VVYVVHDGPYWRVGAAFKQVRAYMLEHGLDGPLFARYGVPLNPEAERPGGVETQVGFLSTEPHEAVVPFHSTYWAPEQAAVMRVNGIARNAETYHEQLRTWAKEHGHAPTGCVTELFLPPDKGEDRTQPQTEIRLSLSLPAAAGSADSAPPSGGQPDGQPGPSDEAGPATAPAAPLPIRPVADLLAEGAFERIVLQVMPPDLQWSPELYFWWEQGVFRLSAIAKLTAHMYPDAHAPVSGLADALADRFHKVTANLDVAPPSPVVERADPSQLPGAAFWRDVLRDLDALLGRVTLRVAPPDVCAAEIAQCVQRIQDFTVPAGSSKAFPPPAAQAPSAPVRAGETVGPRPADKEPS